MTLLLGGFAEMLGDCASGARSAAGFGISVTAGKRLYVFLCTHGLGPNVGGDISTTGGSLRSAPALVSLGACFTLPAPCGIGVCGTSWKSNFSIAGSTFGVGGYMSGVGDGSRV